MRYHLLPLLLVFSAPALAETVVSTRVIRPGTVIGPSDIKEMSVQTDGAVQLSEDVIGLEARVVLYPGRPIRPEDIGAPALVERNQIVLLRYAQGGLQIVTEGKAMARGGQGETIKVLNLASKSTVTGQIQPDGSVRVGY